MGKYRTVGFSFYDIQNMSALKCWSVARKTIQDNILRNYVKFY